MTSVLAFKCHCHGNVEAAVLCRTPVDLLTAAMRLSVLGMRNGRAADVQVYAAKFAMWRSRFGLPIAKKRSQAAAALRAASKAASKFGWLATSLTYSTCTS